MDNAIEVTTEGVQEPGAKVKSSKSKGVRWTLAYTDWNEEAVSDYSTDDDSSFSSFHNKSSRRRGLWIICSVLLLSVIVAGVLVAVLVPSNTNKDRTTDTAAAGTAYDAGDGDNVSDTQPTASPTGEALPEECVPAYNNVDYCFTQELSAQDAEACVDCVWTFLPADDGNCPLLQNSVCNILSQCGCGICVIYLEEYLNCQSSCDLDCLFVTASERSGG